MSGLIVVILLMMIAFFLGILAQFSDFKLLLSQYFKKLYYTVKMKFYFEKRSHAELCQNFFSDFIKSKKDMQSFKLLSKTIIFILSNEDEKMTLTITKENILTTKEKKQLFAYSCFPKITTSKKKLALAMMTSKNFDLFSKHAKELELTLTESQIIFTHEKQLKNSSDNVSDEINLFLTDSFYNMMMKFISRFLSSRSRSELIRDTILYDESMELRAKYFETFIQLKKIDHHLFIFRRVKKEHPELLFIIKKEFKKSNLELLYEKIFDSSLYLNLSEFILTRLININNFNNVIAFLNQLNFEKSINQYILRQCRLKDKASTETFINIVDKKRIQLEPEILQALIVYFGVLKVKKSLSWLLSFINLSDSSSHGEKSMAVVLRSIAAIGSTNVIPVLMTMIQEHKKENLYLNYNREMVKRIKLTMKQIKSKIPPEKIGGLSVTKDENKGLLSITSDDDKRGSLSLESE